MRREDPGLRNKALFLVFHPALHRIGFVAPPRRRGTVPQSGTFSPLAAPDACAKGGALIVSVALSVIPVLRREPVPVRNYPFLWCSDFPPCKRSYTATIRLWSSLILGQFGDFAIKKALCTGGCEYTCLYTDALKCLRIFCSQI